MEDGAGRICVIQPACVLKRALASAAAAFLDVLDGYTLADLTRPSVPLRSLLALPDLPVASA
jgi:Rrf2 family nitric oxide-sensitive transcriptional repressor